MDKLVLEARIDDNRTLLSPTHFSRRRYGDRWVGAHLLGPAGSVKTRLNRDGSWEALIDCGGDTFVIRNTMGSSEITHGYQRKG